MGKGAFTAFDFSEFRPWQKDQKKVFGKIKKVLDNPGRRIVY